MRRGRMRKEQTTDFKNIGCKYDDKIGLYVHDIDVIGYASCGKMINGEENVSIYAIVEGDIMG